MNDIIEYRKIEDMIYEVRGRQVMLDSDLAKLYQCKNGTKSINLAVKRNIDRFKEDFYFRLTQPEYSNILRFQNETLEIKQGQYSKYLPYVFTEEGVAMLSSVLKTEVALIVSINIMRAFVKLRKYINDYELRISNIETKVIDHDNKFNLIFSKLEKKEKPNNHIFFDGQIYDSYSLIVDILKELEEEIIIIDNYIDKSILDIISLLDKKVIIVTNKYNNKTIEKYKSQYDNLKLKTNNKIHDRFIILDKKELYHCGASFKDLGKKCFAITKIEDNNILRELLENIK